jgi:hypothetical protein
MTTFEISVRFFLQLAVVLIVCRLVSALARKLGQPPVVGEMIAGVLMGPSLFGLLAPAAQAWVFPAVSKAVLFAGAQVGLVLYMFCVGLEFRLDLLGARWKSAAVISVSGILAPVGLWARLVAGAERRFFCFGDHDGAGDALHGCGAGDHGVSDVGANNFRAKIEQHHGRHAGAGGGRD